MRRRDFIKVTVGLAAAWPLTARAQQSNQMRRVGVMMAFAEEMLFEPDVSPFRPGSFAAGYDAAGGTSEARMDGIIGIFVLMYFRR